MSQSIVKSATLKCVNLSPHEKGYCANSNTRQVYKTDTCKTDIFIGWTLSLVPVSKSNCKLPLTTDKSYLNGYFYTHWINLSQILSVILFDDIELVLLYLQLIVRSLIDSSKCFFVRGYPKTISRSLTSSSWLSMYRWSL